jgi:transcriptional regulator with XRE-family HTH domain
MRHKKEGARSIARHQKREQRARRGESVCCALRNIMPLSQQQVKDCADCDSMRDVQCDVMMTIDTQWFTDRLAERRLSQRQLAKMMGLDNAAVSLMLRGKRKMSLDEAAQLAVLLQSTTAEILEAAGVQVTGNGQRVKVIGHMSGDGSVGLEAEGIHDMVDAPPGLPGDAVAIQCRTARTEQELVDGWLYFLSEKQISPERAVGTFAMVAIKNNGLHMAHIKRGYRKGTYNIADSSGRIMQNVEVAWASPVFWIKTTA